MSCQVPALVTSDFSVRKLSLTVVGHRTTKKEEGLFDKSTALRSVLHIPQCLNCYIKKNKNNTKGISKNLRSMIFFLFYPNSQCVLRNSSVMFYIHNFVCKISQNGHSSNQCLLR